MRCSKRPTQPWHVVGQRRRHRHQVGQPAPAHHAARQRNAKAHSGSRGRSGAADQDRVVTGQALRQLPRRSAGLPFCGGHHAAELGRRGTVRLDRDDEAGDGPVELGGVHTGFRVHRGQHTLGDGLAVLSVQAPNFDPVPTAVATDPPRRGCAHGLERHPRGGPRQLADFRTGAAAHADDLAAAQQRGAARGRRDGNGGSRGHSGSRSGHAQRRADHPPIGQGKPARDHSHHRSKRSCACASLPVATRWRAG